jgi:hypothetical protein
MPSNLVKMLCGLVADLFKHLHKGVFGFVVEQESHSPRRNNSFSGHQT